MWFSEAHEISQYWTFQQECIKISEASHEIAHLTAYGKKPHNIGETLVKPCVLHATKIVLGESNKDKLKNYLSLIPQWST